jgi:diguanylate cyclase (GGDEF)-like protein
MDEDSIRAKFSCTGARMGIDAGVPNGPIPVVGDRMKHGGNCPASPKLRIASTIAVVLGLVSAAWAAAPVPLTTLSAIHALTNEQAKEAQPVNFEATVVYSRGYENLLFVQDGDASIFVRPPVNAALTPGDRILVRGTMQASFHPLVVGATVTVLHHDPLPAPAPATFEELIRARYDSRLVTVHAVVRAADLVMSTSAPVISSRLQLLAEGGHFEANLDNNDASVLKDLLDAEVEITGVAAGKFDNKMQQTGVVLYLSSLADIKVLKRAGANPWSLPVTPMDKILLDYHLVDLTPRVHVQGTITYYQPGSAIVLQNGSKSLWIETKFRDPLQIGDRVDATGFPDAHNRLLTLTDASIQDSHIFQPITPPLVTWQQLGFWSSNRPDGHLNDLVSIEGLVVTEVREAAQDEYVLTADGRMYTAIYRHPRPAGALPQMKLIPLGSKVRVTGICTVMDVNAINPGGEVPFNILLRSFDDLTVIARPSWLNMRNLISLAAVLLAVVIAVGVWGITLNVKVRRQTATLARRIESEAALERRMAQLEHKRSRILEDINGSRPLAEILEQITELVSFALNDALCWCEVNNGARLGDFQAPAENLRIVRAEIPARSGPPLGNLFAALDSAKLPATPQASARENEALSVGAKLATLAIETRRLYTDLLHRSEFDLLTDVHNRFSLSKRLGSQIEEARENAGIFGLIYIDLDDFKQVNDLCGHHIGDLYLQEVTSRMEQQLRSHDLLARLGGDEFAVLLPMVRNRADVEEIVQRLEHIFRDPVILEGHVLKGSASFGIALYPEDGATEDDLLSTADAAMYATKNLHREIAGMTNEHISLLPPA